MNIRTLTATLLVAALGLAGCVAYEPYPAYQQQQVNPMAESWSAARGAMQDAGLTIVAADETNGVVRGKRGNAEGAITVRMRPDGRVGVEITSKDPDRTAPGLTQALTEAYNRRMGR